eukprot:TRINITY_DN74156_c0_g1_i1.p1 TRINITY_DN74156_c0_g1~~TRINITY_DN74156_c0_g1_i1.p1  ORF type:complete len:469 (+),score=28.58 TRINITY_DN74156_c0_g1_i1:81-1487(+)
MVEEHGTNAPTQRGTFLSHTVCELRNIFKQFDFNENHQLDAVELREAFQALLLPCSEGTIDMLFNGGDGQPGGLTEHQFALFCFHMEQHLLETFDAVDADNSGYIDQSEFHKSIESFGWRLTECQCKEMFARLDTSKDGKLSYIEWRRLMANAPPEGKSWVDTFVLTRIASEGILGDNLRPVRHNGESRVVDLLAGLLAGIVSRTATAPAERVKTEMQLTRASESIMRICRRVAAEGGFKAFFQGNLANCVKVGPQSALFFMLTDYFKRTLPTRVNPASASAHSFFSGSLAGVVSQLMIYPLEPVKTVLTVAPKGSYRGIYDCGRQLFLRGGIRALYNGALPTMIGCIPYAGTQRLVYDVLHREYVKRSTSVSPSPAVGFACGLVSSSVGMTASYPLVLLRTRLQVQGTSPQHPTYGGIFDCFVRTVKHEGLRGLLKGITPNLVKSAPAAALNFAVYDYAKGALSHRL